MRLLAALQLVASGFAFHLDLSLKSLEKAPDDLCDRGVTVANLCANKLREPPPCCATFQGLFIYRNQLERLPDDWLTQCPHLEALSVSDNRLQSLPNDLLAAASRLRRLQASRNQLRALPPELLHNTSLLEQLDLSNNQLENLPSNFLHNTSLLAELFLQRNALSSLPDDLLVSCGRLQQLWLSHNRLRSLSAGLLLQSPLLHTLHLERNEISEVAAGAFDNSAHLRFVDLSHNRISALPPGLFARAASLERLMLNDNMLRVVPPPGSLPQHQLVIDLSNNRLRRVQGLDTAFGEAVVRLDGNRWRCDCDIALVQKADASPQRSRWFRRRQLCHGHPAGRLRLSDAKLLGCSSGETAATTSAPTPAANGKSAEGREGQGPTLDAGTTTPRSPSSDSIGASSAASFDRNWSDTTSTLANDSTASTYPDTTTTGRRSFQSSTPVVIDSEAENADYEFEYHEVDSE